MLNYFKLNGGLLMKTLNVYTLLFCAMCQKRLDAKNYHTVWEETFYCNKCFEKYLHFSNKEIVTNNIAIYICFIGYIFIAQFF